MYMNNYFNKYLKYKRKYEDTRHIGGCIKNILLVGVSSSGKTTISEAYKKQGYTTISMDDYGRQANIAARNLSIFEYIMLLLGTYSNFIESNNFFHILSNKYFCSLYIYFKNI